MLPSNRLDPSPANAATNLSKHGVSFADARALFEDPLALHEVDPDADGEERFVAVGPGSAGEILVVIHALRGQSVRLISARRATRHEVKAHEG